MIIIIKSTLMRKKRTEIIQFGIKTRTKNLIFVFDVGFVLGGNSVSIWLPFSFKKRATLIGTCGYMLRSLFLFFVSFTVLDPFWTHLGTIIVPSWLNFALISVMFGRWLGAFFTCWQLGLVWAGGVARSVCNKILN